MPAAKLLLDTNVIVDYLSVREPFYHEARLLMLLGRMGEFELWMTTTQITDLVYILSDGEKKALIPETIKKMKGLRSFIETFVVTNKEVDRMFTSTWSDLEDALMYESALSLKADAIITRNVKDFENELVPVMTCRQFFDHVNQVYGINYLEIEL